MSEIGGTVEMPMGMAMSIAQNPDAMSAFCKLTDEERIRFINRAKVAHTKEEMTKIVGEIAAMR